jgi:hypothetical protein
VTPLVKLRTIAGARAATGNVLTLDDLTIHGDLGVKVSLNAATTQVVHEATLEGASTVTITVRDPTRGLLRSNIVKTKSTLTLDRVQFRLVKVARRGGELTLTFEETAVNVLREHDDPKKANRDTMTRAQFVQSLVSEPRDFQIPFMCPELKVQQPIAPPAK